MYALVFHCGQPQFKTMGMPWLLALALAAATTPGAQANADVSGLNELGVLGGMLVPVSFMFCVQAIAITSVVPMLFALEADTRARERAAQAL